MWRADERTRTANLVSLRVMIQALQGFAQACNAACISRFLFYGLQRIAIAVVSY